MTPKFKTGDTAYRIYAALGKVAKVTIQGVDHDSADPAEVTYLVTNAMGDDNPHVPELGLTTLEETTLWIDRHIGGLHVFEKHWEAVKAKLLGNPS